MGFVVRLWWVVASKRCVWLVGVGGGRGCVGVVVVEAGWCGGVRGFVSEKRERQRRRREEEMRMNKKIIFK